VATDTLWDFVGIGRFQFPTTSPTKTVQLVAGWYYRAPTWTTLQRGAFSTRSQFISKD